VPAQIERELTLIGKLGLEGYFLIVWDLVRFCREQNNPGAGPRIGRQQRSLLFAWHHGGGSDRHGTAVRALSFRRAGRVARY